MDKIWLQDMTWEEVKEVIKQSGGVAVIPVGSIEQHGWHLGQHRGRTTGLPVSCCPG